LIAKNEKTGETYKVTAGQGWNILFLALKKI
jgi:hypothetical protein